MVGRGAKKEEIMNGRATRMLFAVAALSVFAAVLAGTTNAYVPEGVVPASGLVPAEIYSASTATVTSQQEYVVPAEIYSASTASVTSQQQSQQTSVGEKLDELGPWVVPSIKPHKPQLLQRRSVRQKLGKIGAWAGLDPAINAAIKARSKQTPLATHPVPTVDPATFEGYRG
jgi:hypothetical protein